MNTREFYTVIASNTDLAEDIREMATSLLARLDEKNSSRSEKAREKRAKEVAPLYAKIREYMTDTEKVYTSTEVAEVLGVSVPKTTPLLKALVENGELEIVPHKVTGKAKVNGYKVVVTD